MLIAKAALVFCSLLAPACDSATTGSTAAKADGKADAKSDGKSDGKTDGKAGKAAAKDEATLLAEAKTAAMAGCSLAPNDFTDAKMGTSETLAGSVLHVWTSAGPTPREHRSFVAKKAMVRAMAGDQVEIYIATDGTDPCSLPKSNQVNVATGPVVMSKDGNEVVVVTLADKKPGKYFGRTMQETMADMMGGPPNWLGISYAVKDASVPAYKPGDSKFPWSSLNSEGRSHLELTKFEAGKKLEAKVHACLGGDDFLIGPIDAGFCPDA